jgi:hypothetical protein
LLIASVLKPSDNSDALAAIKTLSWESVGSFSRDTEITCYELAPDD